MELWLTDPGGSARFEKQKAGLVFGSAGDRNPTISGSTRRSGYLTPAEFEQQWLEEQSVVASSRLLETDGFLFPPFR
jgi:hypothetical protein